MDRRGSCVICRHTELHRGDQAGPGKMCVWMHRACLSSASPHFSTLLLWLFWWTKEGTHNRTIPFHWVNQFTGLPEEAFSEQRGEGPSSFDVQSAWAQPSRDQMGDFRKPQSYFISDQGEGPLVHSLPDWEANAHKMKEFWKLYILLSLSPFSLW